MQLVAHGLYTVKDRYFTEFGNGYWVDNKQEGRPYYYLFQDTDGVDWVIPISSQVDNYKRNCERREKARRRQMYLLSYWIGCFEGASVSDWRHVPD